MVKRQTWILLAFFLALAGFAIYQKYNPSTPAPDKNATPSVTIAPVEFLFAAGQGTVTSLSIESREGQSVRVERAAEGAWSLTKPFEAAADPSSAEAAASQVSALRILTRLDLDPADAGLKSPAYTLTVGFSDGKSFVVEVGDATPTGTGYYARKDGESLLVIDKDGLDALLNLLSTPPFLETPTPSPTPTEMPTETPTPAEGADTCPPTQLRFGDYSNGQCQPVLEDSPGGTPTATKSP